MQIEEINISGFGLFNQEKIDGLDPCLNIILGENESGKSTCLEFVRTLLFGSVVGKGARTAPKYPAPPGSEPGGSLLIRTSDNLLFKQTWQPGPVAGKQSLWSVVNGELLARNVNEFSRLTGHITRELYAAVYGFSLDQLQELTSLKNEARVADILYGAGFGLGAVSLPQVLRNLEEKHKEDLFKSKGKNQPINQIMARLRELRQEMKQYSEAMPQFNQIELELAGVSEMLGLNQAELAQMRLFHNCLQDLLKLQSSLPRLQNWQARVAELNTQIVWNDQQVAVLQEHSFGEVKNLFLQNKKLQTELNKLSAEQARLAQTLGSAEQHSHILQFANDISRLQEEKARYTAMHREATAISVALNKLYASQQFVACFGGEFEDLSEEQQKNKLAEYLDKMQATKVEFEQIQAQWSFLNNSYQPQEAEPSTAEAEGKVILGQPN